MWNEVDTCLGSLLNTSMSKPDLVQKTNYAYQLAKAVLYLHERRIISRDLKPLNVEFAVHDMDHVILFDFGLCRVLPHLDDDDDDDDKVDDADCRTGDCDERDADLTPGTRFDQTATRTSTLPTGGMMSSDSFSTIDDRSNMLYEMSIVGTRPYIRPRSC
jgi:serine/threonine protein kinase